MNIPAELLRCAADLDAAADAGIFQCTEDYTEDYAFTAIEAIGLQRGWDGLSAFLPELNRYAYLDVPALTFGTVDAALAAVGLPYLVYEPGEHPRYAMRLSKLLYLLNDRQQLSFREIARVLRQLAAQMEAPPPAPTILEQQSRNVHEELLQCAQDLDAAVEAHIRQSFVAYRDGDAYCALGAIALRRGWDGSATDPVFPAVIEAFRALDLDPIRLGHVDAVLRSLHLPAVHYRERERPTDRLSLFHLLLRLSDTHRLTFSQITRILRRLAERAEAPLTQTDRPGSSGTSPVARQE